jgi:hypothetical protein
MVAPRKVPVVRMTACAPMASPEAKFTPIAVPDFRISADASPSISVTADLVTRPDTAER